MPSSSFNFSFLPGAPAIERHPQAALVEPGVQTVATRDQRQHRISPVPSPFPVYAAIGRSENRTVAAPCKQELWVVRGDPEAIGVANIRRPLVPRAPGVDRAIQA